MGKKETDDAEVKRIADEAEVKRIADEAEAKRIADEAEGAENLKRMEADEAVKIEQQAGDRGNTARVLRQLNALFCRDVPQDARVGAWVPPDGHPVFGGDYDVPDGRYRVTGSEWLFDIDGKKLVNAEHATEQNKFGGKRVIAID